MNIGIVCYASVGGSGIVASELAKFLAARGHNVHVISSETPFRLGGYQAGVAFHSVETPSYPLFREPQYLLALANKIVQVCREHRLDVIHAHYAIPHAAAAYLARQILSSSDNRLTPSVITTLHGTDITLLGSDPSYSETVAFCIDQSDGVTAVSESLKQETYRDLPVKSDIRVIANFLDCQLYRRQPDPALRARFCDGQRFDKLIIHVSNLRPVKRVEAVVEIFRRVRADVRARLLLAGEGPDLLKATCLIREHGLSDAVVTLGEQHQMIPLLSVSDLFLLPSSQESFGLAALEAMACGVPVVASRVGGLPEVIDDGETGFLRAPDDLDGMAKAAVAVLTDSDLHARIAAAGVRKVRQQFCSDLIVPRYEAYYDEVRADRVGMRPLAARESQR